jgi:transposase
MPWKPRVTERQVSAALRGAESWRQVLTALDYAYHGKNIETVRKWAARWNLSTAHLSDNRGVRWGRPRYTTDELRAAVAKSLSWAETLRRLGYCPSGNNWRTLKKRVAELGLSTDHFDPYAARRRVSGNERIPLARILVEGSTYSRGSLKLRLYESGLKKRECELCGQDDTWRGRRISLILDHINGIRDDNRLQNLRIVCPNCAAGLETHCGRRTTIDPKPRKCRRCGSSFVPKRPEQRYCSRACGSRAKRPYKARPDRRRVLRPPMTRLLEEVVALGYAGVGRKYGVSDNAIRKWLRDHQRDGADGRGGGDQTVVEIPRRTWPKRSGQPAAA